MGQAWSNFFPPRPVLTEENLPDQNNKVFIVTGASSGVGQQLATFLYKHNARVYIATRSKEKADRAITAIRQRYPSSRGALIFLFLDLGDLTTIHKSADEFLNKESRLDVLWLNAGVMVPPQGSKTAQGYELQLGTNNIGHFLFTKLLHPVLFQTAQTSPADSVRVIWVSSGAVDLAPSPAIDFTNMDYHRNELAWTKYARSKAGSVLHATEFARRTKEEGIISLSLNPGNLATGLQRYLPGWQSKFWEYIIAYPAKYGAYTELYAGLHPDITAEHSNVFIAPWGRLATTRKDLFDPALGRRFWDWTEEQVKPYI